MKVRIELDRDNFGFANNDAVREIKAFYRSHVSVSRNLITIEDQFYERPITDILDRRGLKYSRSTPSEG